MAASFASKFIAEQVSLQLRQQEEQQHSSGTITVRDPALFNKSPIDHTLSSTSMAAFNTPRITQDISSVILSLSQTQKKGAGNNILGTSRTQTNSIVDYQANPAVNVVAQLNRDVFLNPSEENVLVLSRFIETKMGMSLGECTFDLGFDEFGNVLNFHEQEWEVAFSVLREAAKKLNSNCTLLYQNTKGEVVTGCILIRHEATGHAEDLIEVRVACVGNVDAGKSTVLGVLTSGDLDNGRGQARQALFKHKHEMDTGRTSSVGVELMGFDGQGVQVVKSDTGRKLTWEDVSIQSSKMITFLDLAGHEKYLKTTVFGMTAWCPDYVMLIIGSNAGIVGMTKEHLGLALALNVPVFVVVTKIDMCPSNVLEATLKQVAKILKSAGCRKMPIFIDNRENTVKTARKFISERICPIFQISNVNGGGLDLLKLFLNLLPNYQKYDPHLPVNYQITDTFSVPGVGTVVCGTVQSGIVRVGDILRLGPDAMGHFVPSQVKSIQRKRSSVNCAIAGQSASFALKKIKRSFIRKGMVLVGRDADVRAVWEVEAEILILYHSSTISVRYQAMVHCGTVRQTASIVAISDPTECSEPLKSQSDSAMNSTEDNTVPLKKVIRTGDRALVRFRFMQYPEYIKVGSKILFREGRTKGVGRVSRVFYDTTS